MAGRSPDVGSGVWLALFFIEATPWLWCIGNFLVDQCAQASPIAGWRRQKRQRDTASDGGKARNLFFNLSRRPALTLRVDGRPVTGHKLFDIRQADIDFIF